MKLLFLPPLLAQHDALIESLQARGLSVTVAEEAQLAAGRALLDRCDLLVLPSERSFPLIQEIRAERSCSNLVIAVHGEGGPSRQSLEAGADLWLDPKESAADLALRLAALVRRIEIGTAPRIDQLTGLAGTERFMEQIRREYDRSIRYKRSVALMLLQLDSTELGAADNDALLLELSQVLRGLVRDLDLLGRLGAQRFAILLPETDAGGGMVAAERVRSTLQSHQFQATGSRSKRTGGRGDRQTLSIGIAAIPARGMENASDLVGRAAEALGQAQRGGGNRCIPFGAPDVIWSRTAPDPMQQI